MTENPTVEAEPSTEGDGRPLEVYEWGGGLIAGLGIVMTPLLTALPALYCALKIHRKKPLSAASIGLVFGFSILFWISVLYGRELLFAVVQSATLVGTSAVGLLALGGSLLAAIYFVSLLAGDSSVENE